jgi:hypothetical protein
MIRLIGEVLSTIIIPLHQTPVHVLPPHRQAILSAANHRLFITFLHSVSCRKPFDRRESNRSNYAEAIFLVIVATEATIRRARRMEKKLLVKEGQTDFE